MAMNEHVSRGGLSRGDIFGYLLDYDVPAEHMHALAADLPF